MVEADGEAERGIELKCVIQIGARQHRVGPFAGHRIPPSVSGEGIVSTNRQQGWRGVGK